MSGFDTIAGQPEQNVYINETPEITFCCMHLPDNKIFTLF